MDVFKDQVFFAALVEAYKSDSLIFKLIKEKDLFNPYDGIDLEEMQKATGLGKNLIRNIPPPSMCENCPDGMNYYMASSLHYYHSRELDSIAKTYYRLHMKALKRSGLLY